MSGDSARSVGPQDDWWAALARELGANARRQLFPAEVSVGGPDDRCTHYRLREQERLDLTLRTDVIAALLLQILAGPTDTPERPPALVWLTRPGTPAPHDLDAAWLAASRAAYAEAGLDLTMAVITPHGWVELTRP